MDEFDRGWDEYDDEDEEELNNENEEEKKGDNNNNYNKEDYSSGSGYNKNNDYYGYNNNYSYGSKKFRKKKGGRKYSNKKRPYNKDSGYKNSAHDFMNTNSNYMRKPNAEPPNNNYIYGKGRAYSNRDKFSWTANNFYRGGNKNGDNTVSKPMFTNSKLENNGNPEGNFVKIDVLSEEKKYNLTNIGEIPIKDSGTNSLLTIKSLLIGKDPDKKENTIKQEKQDENKNNEMRLSNQVNSSNNNINNFNDNSSSLPWRSGTLLEKGGGGYKKDYYKNNYRNNKKDNYYYYSSGKAYNRNKYSLNQPQSKKSNKFD